VGSQDDEPPDRGEAAVGDESPCPDVGAASYAVRPWAVLVGRNPAEAAQASSTILAGVVRDLSGPLAELVALAVMLTEEHQEGAAHRQATAELMHRKALLVQNRSENLQSAVALWDGTFDLRLRLLELNEIVAEVAALLRPVLTDKHQRLELIMAPEVGNVCADARRLAQILINLVVNAAEHSGPGSTIRIEVGAGEGGPRVSVADRGTGIPADFLPGSFDLLRQPLPAVTSGRLSLGLAVTRALTEAHRGKMGARTRRRGGTRVWIELPNQPEGAAEAAAG
jgi:two-component system sensor histidine kinase KdpD